MLSASVMKSAGFALPLVISSLACEPSSELPAPPPLGADATPVGIALSGFRGMTQWTEALDRLRDASSSMYGIRASWAEIEPSPGSVDLNTSAFESLEVVARIYPEFLETLAISIQVINVSVREMPADLMELPFNDPVVLSRMDGVIDALASHPLAMAIDCILVGQESDTYLAKHPDETGAFIQLLQHATDRIREKLSQASVATTVTFNAVRNQPEIAIPLIDSSDWAVFTYYPLELNSPTLTMRPLSDVPSDLDFLIGQAGGKPVAFWELGYPSNPVNLGSQERMAEFVREAYGALEPYRRTKQLRFVQYFMLHDYPIDLARQFAEEQGLSGPGSLEYLTSLGLREYENEGRAKLAWPTYVRIASAWADR